jgi:hypothetical protein
MHTIRRIEDCPDAVRGAIELLKAACQEETWHGVQVTIDYLHRGDWTLDVKIQEVGEPETYEGRTINEEQR